MPAPVINTSISLLATSKNTLAMPAIMPMLAITFAMLALSTKLNDYSNLLWFLAFTALIGVVVLQTEQ